MLENTTEVGLSNYHIPRSLPTYFSTVTWSGYLEKEKEREREKQTDRKTKREKWIKLNMSNVAETVKKPLNIQELIFFTTYVHTMLRNVN